MIFRCICVAYVMNCSSTNKLYQRQFSMDFVNYGVFFKYILVFNSERLAVFDPNTIRFNFSNLFDYE